jgi:hypothetical protein
LCRATSPRITSVFEAGALSASISSAMRFSLDSTGQRNSLDDLCGGVAWRRSAFFHFNRRISAGSTVADLAERLNGVIDEYRRAV